MLKVNNYDTKCKLHIYEFSIIIFVQLEILPI